jgi:hypothetical protein
VCVLQFEYLTSSTAESLSLTHGMAIWPPSLVGTAHGHYP